MNRFMAILAAMMLLFCCAAAEEGAADASPTPGIVLITPTPTAAPAGEVFASEDIIITLPAGLNILAGDELASYEAAVEDDFPGAGRTLLAAANEDYSAALVLSLVESKQSAAEFAREAAQIVLGGTDAVSEVNYGENSYSAFTCAIGEQQYKLYFLAGGDEMLVIASSGLTDAESETMLTGLNF